MYYSRPSLFIGSPSPPAPTTAKHKSRTHSILVSRNGSAFSSQVIQQNTTNTKPMMDI